MPSGPAGCSGTSGLAIDPGTLVVTGSGTGHDGTQWRVQRMSDNVIMASGSGLSPSFSFTGAYSVTYQLQFAKADNVFQVPGCSFSFSPPSPPSCSGTSGIAIDADTMIATGTGTGANGTQWRVVRVSDNNVMASGSGLSASFSFLAAYATTYQLQFGTSVPVWSSSGCTFSFAQPPPIVSVNGACITNVGLNIIANRIKGIGTEPLHLAWGRGGGGADPQDTILSTESSDPRVAMTSALATVDISNDTYTLSGSISANAAKTITNWGVFDAPVGGSLLLHVSITPGESYALGQVGTFFFSIQFVRGQ